MGKGARRRRTGAGDGDSGKRAPARHPAAAPSTGVAARTLGAIFVVALAVRLLHVWQLESSPFAELLLGDSAGYDRWARQIAGGDWRGSDVFYQAPLYPYLLGLVYAVLGADVATVRVCQGVVGAGACVLLADAAARFFSPRVGVAVGVALALYAPAIFMDATLQKSVIDLLLVSGLLWLLSRTIDRVPPAATWVGLGVVLGALGLTRENALVLVPALGIWLWLERRDWLRRGALVAAGLAIVLVPVMARNGLVGGEWHLTTSQFGPNFYIGNRAGADGTYEPLRFGRGDPLFERDDAAALAEASVGRELTPAGVSSYWFGTALTDIASAPGEWIRLLGRKLALTFNAVEVVDTESQYAHAEHSTILAVTGWITHFGVLVPLAALGMVANWPRRRRLAPLYLMVSFYTVSIVAFYVFSRYRYPLVPMLLLFAVAGGDYAVRVWRRETVLARAPAVLALVLVCAIGANWPMLAKSAMRAVTYNSLGTAHHERGELGKAIGRYETAVALMPDYAGAHGNLASALVATGAPDRAIGHYRQAIALDPGAGGLRFNYGNALLALEQYAEAAEQFRRAIDAWPDDAEAYNNLGMALGSLGRLGDAATAFRQAIQRNPTDAFAHRNLGVALDELGDATGARRHLEEAARLDGAAGSLR